MAEKPFLGKKLPDNSVDTLGVKIFGKIDLSHTVSEINAFVCFTQKFAMATQNGGKTIFGENCSISHHL